MPKSFIGANVLVVGGGISGQGAKYALTKRGAHCFLYDDSVNAEIPKIRFDCVVVSPSIRSGHKAFEYARKNRIPLIGEAELGYRLNGGTLIAVTGTNGKTTVTELIAAVLNRGGINAAACGNIGVSFAQTAADGDYDAAVVEISSFQLETTDRFRPHVACITNISPDHLDRHGSMENYARTKLRIAENQTGEDYLILSQDDIPLFALEGFLPRAQVLYTSLRGRVRGAYLLDGRIFYMDECVCERERIRLAGDFNVANVLSAVCACKLMGVDNGAITDVLGTFTPDAHRLRLVDRFGGKSYYDDSKGTNIGATIKACEAMNGDTCLIAGGSDKGYEYDALFAALPAGVKRVIAIGETAEKLRRAGARNGYEAVQNCTDLTSALLAAASGGEENVLLSPASASFDMFKDYADRGEKFERCVMELKERS